MPDLEHGPEYWHAVRERCRAEQHVPAGGKVGCKWCYYLLYIVGWPLSEQGLTKEAKDA